MADPIVLCECGEAVTIFPNQSEHVCPHCSRTLMVRNFGPADKPLNDPVSRPVHYTQHPSGVECIQITEHMGFCVGNAIKYLWRAGLKTDAIEDLKKAAWYVNREIERRTRA